ncbi:hypothetical protein [Absidia glauca]|uniref:Uncharacterized protein n=1 Tax=Absidia glauca TaxID=4829 RepID=A0A163KVN9_ABSGL|nr:hypothetical protein [Absidia glauca]
MNYNINHTMAVEEDEILSYYFHQDDYQRRPSSSSLTSSTSSRRSSSQFVSSVRQSLRLSSLFTRRRSSSSSSFSRFSLPSLSPSSSTCTVGDDEPLSPKQMEIEQLIADYPERTVRLSVTPHFAI